MGFWDEVGEAIETVGRTTWEVTKIATKVATVTVAATALTVATGGVGGAAIVGGLVAVEGFCIKKAAEDCDNEFFQSVGKFVTDVGVDTATGGVLGALTNSAKVGKTVAQTFTALDQTKDIYDDTRLCLELASSPFHAAHQARGRSYDSDCPICAKK